MIKKLKKKLMQQSHAGEVAGVGWYREDQYAALRAAVPDPGAFPATWEGWERQAERELRDHAARGYHVHRVPIDVDLMLAWATRSSRVLDAAARQAYVLQVLSETHHHMH